MSRAYSNHFNSNATPGVATGLTDTIALDTGRRIGAGEGHARRRTKVARVQVPTAGMTSGDELRLMQFKSGDRVFSILVTAAGDSTTYAADLGLYKSGARHDGAVIDADLFGSALAMASGVARVDEFTQATTLGNADRGKTLWELAAIGAAAYTSDPLEDWDLVLTSTATGTAAVEDIVVEVEYTSGD